MLFCSFLVHNSSKEATELAKKGTKFPFGLKLEACMVSTCPDYRKGKVRTGRGTVEHHAEREGTTAGLDILRAAAFHTPTSGQISSHRSACELFTGATAASFLRRFTPRSRVAHLSGVSTRGGGGILGWAELETLLWPC